MVFLYWFIGSVVAIAIYALIRTSYRFFKKKRLYAKDDIKGDLINGLSSFGLSFVFAFIMLFLFKSYSFFNATTFFFCLTTIVILLSPSKIVALFKEKHFVTKRSVLAGIMIVFFSLEAFLFNANSYERYSETSIDFSSSLVVETFGQKTANSSMSFSGGNYFVINLGENDDYLTFVTDTGNSSQLITVNFYTKNEKNQWNKISDAQINPVSELTLRVNIPSSCKGNNTKVEFVADTGRYKDPTPIILKGLIINQNKPFNFSFIRFLVIGGLASFFTCISNFFARKEKAVKENPSWWWEKLDIYKKTYIAVGGLTLAVLIFFLIYAFGNSSEFFRTYDYVENNIQNIANVDIYSDLFYSILHGRVSLTLKPSESLLAAEQSGINVYSSAIRSKMGISSSWDHAYYHGNYYSYYGILPVFLIYFPAYWLSGCQLIPNPLFGLFVSCIFLIPSVYLLLMEMDRHISKGNVNFRRLNIIFVMSFFLMLTMNNLCLKDGYFHEGIYHLPIALGLVEATLFLLFAFRAYRKADKRLVNLLVSGIFYASLLLTRPNLCLIIIFACPLFLAMLFDKEISWKKRIISFLPLFGVLIVGAVLTFTYNYVRYDSIMEFGQSYQMNGDQLSETFKVNTYQVEKFLPAMYHFLFQGPAFYSSFPYISCSSVRYSFDIVSYCSSSYGVCLIPIFLLQFAAPFCFKEDKGLRWTFSLVPAFVIFFVFTTYSKAGICPRYLIENFFFSTIGSIGVFMYVMNRFEENEEKSYGIPAMFFAILFFSSFLALNISYDTFDGQNIGDFGGLLVKVKDAFTPFYY